MRGFIEVFAVVLLCQQCSSLPLEEDTVVSVYTTHPTTMGTNPTLDVYHQIANNLAERITSPIYKFLGINSTTAKPVEKIELQDEEDLTKKHEMKPIDNDISKTRDVEELSVEGLKKKPEKKPEKITLYSSYLPANSDEASSRQVEANDTWNELDDPFNWDDDQTAAKPKEGPFIYILELLGSMVQLVWGGIMALFRPNSGSS
ncbi:hypothetical protein PYW07_008214 [Mythimna separata]|uniref:Uncharacterized protein n=1 Tax=Mythimna separata TaxID=271217 RepID=A0AAD8DNR1_MYTSE|nr:hypothetical protein PYW07_008214 [Mythimna separata]